MLARPLDSLLGDDCPAEVRRHIGTLTAARLCANACFRYAPPFLATIARGTDVSLDDIGVALAAAELAGLLSPLNARLVDRMPRRSAMVLGLLGVVAGTVLAASSQGMVLFAIGLIVLAQSKVTFDLGLGSWVSDHVPYETRSRVVGVTEIAWAGGLLLGVSTMGLVTGALGWRAGYATGAIAVLMFAGVVARRLPREPHHTEVSAREVAGDRGRRSRLGLRAVLAILISGSLMGSVQFLFVTFGSWLEDSFDFTAAMLAAVAFALGMGELGASITSSRRTDAWGKERSIALGAALMVPAALGLVFVHDQLWLGLPLLAIAVLSFEFGIVSSVAIGTTLVPGSPALGMSLMLAGGTLGRAITSIPATRLYADHGIAWPAAMSAVLAAATLLAAIVLHRTRPEATTLPTR
jgi:predicted MFS family arabinose efflux permease